MPSQSIGVEISFPSLPEGWQGTPDDLLQFISENAEFRATGNFLTGQIGGTRPTSDIGLFINGAQLEVWDANVAAYVPILTVPIGGIVDWSCGSVTPPDNYLFAEGQLVNIADYTSLYDVIGRTYSDSDDNVLKFRLPDGRGRVSVSAGTGQYNPKDASGVPNGNMISREVGEYFGHEWLDYRESAPSGSMVPRYNPKMTGDSSNNFVSNTTYFHGVSQPSVVVRKIIRVK